MTQSVVPQGVVGPVGATGPTGPAGPAGSGGGHLETTLASSTSIGATSLTVANAQANVTNGLGFVMIDRFTTNAEFRKVATVSGTTVSGLLALTKAHSAGAEVVFFQGGSVPANWFGAKGDNANTTDDEPALQWALTETARQGLWLEGENRSYKCRLPLVMPGSGKLRQLNLSAVTGAGGLTGDPAGAFLMVSQGLVRTFAGAAATDVVTTTDGVHGMANADPPNFSSHHSIPVLFKGSSLPGGVTAGKIYYSFATSTTEMRIASNRAVAQGVATSGSNVLTGMATKTVQAFTVGMVISNQIGTIPQGTTVTGVTSTTITMSVAATASGNVTVYGGDLVNLTSDGSGTVYNEMMSMSKAYIDDVFINGGNVTNLNGFAATLQQPGFQRKLRVDNCPGTGVTLSGQQTIMENLEIINCGTGIAFEDMGMCWFFGTNIESNGLRAVHVRALAQIFFNGGAEARFHGFHDELQNVDAVVFDLEGGSNIVVENGHSSMHFANQKYVYSHSPTGTTYGLEQVYFSGANPGAPILVHDVERGHNILVWEAAGTTPQNNRRQVTRWDAPFLQATAYPERHPIRVLRPGGGYTGHGGQGDAVPSWASRPGSGQTAAQYEWLDKSGNMASTVNKDGYLTTFKTSAPADADLAAGQIFFWFDQTNGAAKLMCKAKEAGGTVRTGSVTLT